MSIFGNISMLGSALRSFQYGLDVASNNIANAATVGYSRQVLNLEPNFPIADGRLQFGQGVNGVSVGRIRDIFLDSRIKFELSELGRSSVRTQALTELAAIFPEVASASATNGLKGAIDNIVTAWTNLSVAVTPAATTAAQTLVRDSLKAVADMLQLDARKVFDLQLKLDDQVRTTVIQINELTAQIANLNTQIKLSSARAQGNAPGVLLDLREQAAQKLAKLIDANFTIIGDGTMVVTFSGGLLADGTQAKALALKPSLTDPGRTAIGYYQSPNSAPIDMTAKIAGGKLGGLLQARDGEVEKARLDLNRMAFGIISRSNEINRSFVAGDGTTSHNLFSGYSAADIVIDPIVYADPSYVGNTRDTLNPLAAGDLAKMQMGLKNFIQFSSMRTATGVSLGGGFTIDPDVAIGVQTWGVALTPSATPASQGQLVISTTGNAKTVFWDITMTLNEIIHEINDQGAGAFYATFDEAAQKVILIGQTPLTVHDMDSSTGNIADVLMLSAAVTSSAPINNYPVYDVAHQVDPFSPMNNVPNTLNLFNTPGATGGTIQVDGINVNWVNTDEIMINISNAINAVTPTPRKVTAFWNANSQTIQLEKAGDLTNPGSHDFASGNDMTSIQVVDVTGNLTRTLNLDTNTNSTKIFEEMIVAMGARKSAESVLEQQAQALVDQTTQLQDNVSKVDLNQELAQARLYQRSYEASVRLQGILDEMLNVLINRTGTASSSGSSI